MGQDVSKKDVRRGVHTGWEYTLELTELRNHENIQAKTEHYVLPLSQHLCSCKLIGIAHTSCF